MNTPISYNLQRLKGTNISLTWLKYFYLPVDIFRKKQGNIFYAKTKKALRLGERPFDLIHAHFIWPSGYAGAKLKEDLKVPLVITAHGYDVYGLPFRNEWWLNATRQTLAKADYIITVSRSNYDILTQKLGVPEKKVMLIPNGYNERYFHPMDRSSCRELLHLPQDKKILLNIGNLLAAKGQKYLIDAVYRIHKVRPDVLCVIIGSGRLMSDLKKQVDMYGLKASIKFVGEKPHDEIPLWINSCDLLVSSSIAEGNPTVLFECIGCGTPFIGTRVGGVPDVITSDQYGLLANPYNADDLAGKLLEGLDRDWDPEAIRQYSKLFTWDNVTKDILGVYGRVLR
jgi:glycosyltransferase involved in cell wall biosynthesis